MSTSQASLFEWKQEVNRCLAEHRSRKGPVTAGPRVVATAHRDQSRRGAEAAARVAERFAHAPSYLDMLVDQPQRMHADEAHFAAVETEAEPMTAGFQANSEGAPAWETAAMGATEDAKARSSEQPIPIVQATEPRGDARLFGSAGTEFLNPPSNAWSESGAPEEIQAEDAELIHGNLIEFPREVVATRRIRPRLVEGPYAGVRDAQLSIFEVDPEVISTEVEPPEAKAAEEWNGPEWSGIRLDAQPAEEIGEFAEPGAAVAAEIELAPLSRRLLALTVDGTLICAAVLAAGAMFAANASSLPGPRGMGIAAGAALVVAAVLYELLFFTLAQATPGMKYAHIGLRTFGDEKPTREQRWRRLAAIGLSVLPAGLGLMWALFDEQSLCWHDRLSQTYLKESF